MMVSDGARIKVTTPHKTRPVDRSLCLDTYVYTAGLTQGRALVCGFTQYTPVIIVPSARLYLGCHQDLYYCRP